MDRKKRNPFVAFLLTILCGGLGQVYNGQLAKGTAIYLTGGLLFFIFSLSGLQYSFNGLVLGLCIGFLYALCITVDAIFIAVRRKEIALKRYNKWYFYLLFAVLAYSISFATDDLLITKSLGIKAYKIPSESMIPTLEVGDHIMANLKFYEEHEVKRGDLIIFPFPEDTGKDFFKRAVAIEGDMVELKNKDLYLDGKLVNEPYVQHVESEFVEGRDNFGPITVPQGKIFTLGDNRDRSYDSRFWGFVDEDAVIGKALYIYWAKDKKRLGKDIK